MQASALLQSGQTSDGSYPGSYCDYVAMTLVATLCGETQLCAGLKHGCIAGARAHRQAMIAPDTQQVTCMVRIDAATNAFHSVHRAALIQNAGTLWPRARWYIASQWTPISLRACW
jgi:hypothetical protein